MEPSRPAFMFNRTNIAIALLLAALVVAFILSLLAILVAFERLRVGENPVNDPGVVLATTGLALFTGLLVLGGGWTAYAASKDIRTATDANKANLALQLDNRFHSDRALRIRHGAVTFLANHHRDENGELRRNLDLDCDDQNKLSPYGTDENRLLNGLTSDLIDIFNYYDWIGYLAFEKSDALDLEVVARKFGPWIINYYQLCKSEIDRIQNASDDRVSWPYLEDLYKALIDKERKDWYGWKSRTLHKEEEQEEKNSNLHYYEERGHGELAAFLLREHVRSHRGQTL
jgi:hypothetical protein